MFRFIWNKEELTQQRNLPLLYVLTTIVIELTISYRGIILSTSYKTLSNILLSSLTP
jgi:hypothetical protein